MRSRAQLIVRVLQHLDVLVLALLVVTAWPSALSRIDLLFVLLLVPFNASLFQYYGLYESHRVEGFAALVRNVLSAQIVGFSVAATVLLATGQGHHFEPLGIYFASGLAVVLVLRGLLYAGLSVLRSHGVDVRRTCVIGSMAAAGDMESSFARHPSWGLKVYYYGEAQPDGSGEFYRYPTGALKAQSLTELIRTESVDEVLILAGSSRVENLKSLMTLCRDYGITSRLLVQPDTETESAAPQLEEFLGSVAYLVQREGNTAVLTLAAKRLMDVVLSSILLVCLAPVFAIVAILVKLSSDGPIFFCQKRVGRGGRHFKIFKFRTMVAGAEGFLPSVSAKKMTDGPAFKSKDDWRVTPVGRWLRRYSLDELPQIANVLKGDMSLVGPRPLPVHEALEVRGVHRRRFTMRPGITCYWQVSGRSDISFARWMSMDIEYVDGWSLWVDAKLLFRTIPAVISGRGAY